MKNKNQLLIIGIFLLVFTLGSIILNTETEQETNDDDGTLADNENQEITNDDTAFEELKGAGNWVLGLQTIYGEGEWAKPWISGSGTWGDPYLIENCTFDADGGWTGLTIGFTSSHFKINNCTFKNTPIPLALNMADHGIITNCNFSGMSTGNTNDAGIYIVAGSDNHTIENCVIENGGDYGIYLDDVSIDNNIINNTIYNSGGYGIYVIETSHDTLIENNTIYSNDDMAIYIRNSRCQVINNTIYDQPLDYGIGLFGSGAQNTDIINNTIKDAARGIYISADADGPTIEGNILENCDYGIYLNSIEDVIMSGNKMIDTGIFLDGGTAELGSLTIYTNNTVNGNPVYFYKNQNNLDNSNFTKEGDPGQIILYNCDDSVIKDFNLSRSMCGIELFYSERNTIKNVTAKYNNYAGIYLARSSRWNTVYNNTVNNNPSRGILLEFSSDENNITYNILRSNGFAGINLRTSDYNNVTYNIVSGSDYGMNIYNSENNRIFNNTADDNTIAGIEVNYDSNNNQILYNNASDTTGNQNIGIRVTGVGPNYPNGNNVTGNICNDNEDTGIYIRNNADDNYVINNTVNGNTNDGIYLDTDCDGNLIKDNGVMDNNGHGIHLNKGSGSTCDYNIIENNNIWDNEEYGIILDDDSDENVIVDNIIKETGAGGTQLHGIFLAANCVNNTISNNEVLNHVGDGIRLENADDNKIFSNTLMSNAQNGINISGMAFDGSDENFIKNNTILNNGNNGINLQDSCDDNRILNNTIYDNGLSGINIQDDCNTNIVLNNTIKETSAGGTQSYGIYLTTDCDYNNISENTISGHTGSSNCGIEISMTCTYNNISDNIVFDNWYGIYISVICTNNTIYNNILIDNKESSINLDDSCSWNYITENTLNNSKYGIYIKENCDRNYFVGNIIGNNTVIGAYLDDQSGSADNCKDNQFYKNRFLNNTLHAQDDMNTVTNYWYDPINKIGNFWDNYTGVDANDNGIGDTPYNISGEGNRQDKYPIWEDKQDVFPAAPSGGGGGGGGVDVEEVVIPGYNIFILIGVICITLMILNKKHRNKLK